MSPVRHMRDLHVLQVPGTSETLALKLKPKSANSPRLPVMTQSQHGATPKSLDSYLPCV